MATGIVSIDALFEGWTAIAWVLFGANLVAYPVLWVLTLLRLIRWPSRLLADLVDHRTGRVSSPSSLAPLCSATSGSCWRASLEWRWRSALWRLPLWVLVTYTFFVAVVVSSSKAGVEQALSGGWLLTAVATQWLTVFGTLLTPTLPDTSAVLSAGSFGFLSETLPFLKAFTLFFWAAATWWIPLLVLIGVWRHVLRRFPLVSSPSTGAWSSRLACTASARSN